MRQLVTLDDERTPAYAAILTMRAIRRTRGDLSSFFFFSFYTHP